MRPPSGRARETRPGPTKLTRGCGCGAGSQGRGRGSARPPRRPGGRPRPRPPSAAVRPRAVRTRGPGEPGADPRPRPPSPPAPHLPKLEAGTVLPGAEFRWVVRVGKHLPPRCSGLREASSVWRLGVAGRRASAAQGRRGAGARAQGGGGEVPALPPRVRGSAAAVAGAGPSAGARPCPPPPRGSCSASTAWGKRLVFLFAVSSCSEVYCLLAKFESQQKVWSGSGSGFVLFFLPLFTAARTSEPLWFCV